MTPLTQIHAEGRVAERYGLEEAIFLHALMFWYRTNRGNGQNFHGGRWWTYNSVKAFEEVFPWWTAGQIRRIIARCREKEAMLTGSFSQDRRDRTAWYTPSDELLELYGENVNCICTNQQMQPPDSAGSCAESGKCNIRNTWGNHGETDIPPYSPPEGDSAPADSDSGDKPVPKAGRPSRRFVPPDVEQVRSYCRERNNGIDPEAFVNYYASKGWTVGRAPMKDWKAAVRTWEQRRRSQRKDGGNDDDIFQ